MLFGNWVRVLIFGILAVPVAAETAASGILFDRDTTVTSSPGWPAFRLDTMPLGGALQLSIGDPGRVVAADVTALVWVDSTRCLYSVSPVYGAPGVFEWSTRWSQPCRLVGPRNKSAAYPAGADWFQLEGYDSVRREAVYKRVSDVDAPDLQGQLRRAMSLRARVR
jgi:hypothetical protein